MKLNVFSHIVAPVKLSSWSVEIDDRTAVTIVVTLDGIGSNSPVDCPLCCRPDAGTVE